MRLVLSLFLLAQPAMGFMPASRAIGSHVARFGSFHGKFR